MGDSLERSVAASKRWWMLIVVDDRRAIVVNKSGLSELLRTPIQRNGKRSLSWRGNGRD